MPTTYAPTPEAVAAHKAKLAESIRGRQARLAARTLSQRREDYIRCAHCDGHGAFSNGHPNDPWAGSYRCAECEDGEIPGNAGRFDAAVALWRETPGTEDGDEKWSAVAARFGDDLADLLVDAKELEPGAAAAEWAKKGTGDAESL